MLQSNAVELHSIETHDELSGEFLHRPGQPGNFDECTYSLAIYYRKSILSQLRFSS